jgi:hypothetical protein
MTFLESFSLASAIWDFYWTTDSETLWLLFFLLYILFGVALMLVLMPRKRRELLKNNSRE